MSFESYISSLKKGAGREVESGEKSTRPASLDPPDPFSYTIGNYFEFTDFKTVRRKTFINFYFTVT